MKKKIALLPGDGIGPEIMDAAVKVLQAVEEKFNHEFNFSYGEIGGIAIDNTGLPLPLETLEMCMKSDAVLLAAVGGPKWDSLPKEKRAETGLLQLRKQMGLYANIRPVQAFEPLLDASPLKRELIEGIDLVIVRELSSGIYFGAPSERRENGKVVVDTLYYTEEEMKRVIKYAFELASIRKGKVTSIDKANVLESSRMWREITNEIAKEYKNVEVQHMLVDSAAMQLITNPSQFDVIVTENMFGDILSDEASVLSGSIGLLASASISTGGTHLYEPIHGSAPDIAGKNIANPLGMILSVASMLRHSFQLEKEAKVIEKAVDNVLSSGFRTADILEANNDKICATTDMAKLVVEQILGDFATKKIMEVYS